ncbi:MAG: AMP-binding protein [Gammaproteobacteria bacterium]|nr:AMP-binding protein [Gammaproteobacteria bacterium]MCP4880332.1 AMP-binding protein [Gammaproteobacteria bacterium]
MTVSYKPVADTVRGVIDHYAALQPDASFAYFPEIDEGLSYSELRQQLHNQIAVFQAQGIEPGDTVSFMMCNGRTTLILFLAAIYGGYIISPLNPAAGLEQLTYVVDHSDTKVIFTTDEFADQVKTIVGQLPASILIQKVDVDSGCSSSPSGKLNLASVSPAQDGMLMYTSGTTGRPKGVVLTHKNLLAGGMNTAVSHELTHSDRGMCVLPLCHINAQCVTVMAPLVSGSAVVMPHNYRTSQFWPQMIAGSCTWFSVVPTIISYLAHQSESLDLMALKSQLSKVKFGRSASAALPPALHAGFEEKFGIPIVETMGMTETSAQILSNPMPPKAGKYGSPGIAFGTEVMVADFEGEALPRGVEGELMVRGDCVMRCYYKNPETTAKELTTDGWLHTGDLARMDEDGFIFITGRIKELIIKGGENIAPREIDDVLYTHPSIKEAAAVGIPHDDYGQDVIACVVLGGGEPLDETQLKEYCLPRLGKVKMPTRIYFMDDLPKGPSGKVQRLKLVDMVQSL